MKWFFVIINSWVKVVIFSKSVMWFVYGCVRLDCGKNLGLDFMWYSLISGFYFEFFEGRWVLNLLGGILFYFLVDFKMEELLYFFV